MVIDRRSAVECVASLGVGALVSTGYSVAPAAAILMPALSMRQRSRAGCYAGAFGYYAGASWPVILASRNFFGPSATMVEGIVAWGAAALLLALPWALAWTENPAQLLWRVPLALAASVVPPLGIIGWASPLTAAGVLFPGTAWAGLLAVPLFCALLSIDSTCLHTAIGIAILTLASYASKGTDPRPPPGWEAVNTNFGALAHGPANPLREYQAAEWIQNRAESSNARVLIFPEMVVSRWTAATELFWQQTLANLSASGKTILFGAGIPELPQHRQFTQYDFAGAAAVLRGEPAQIKSRAECGSGEGDQMLPYQNAIVIFGAHRGVYVQHIPVPLGMWHPFDEGGVPLNLTGRAVIQIGQQRAAILICYEQLLVFPGLLSMSQHPTVLVAVANDYWVEGTPIPRYQRTAVQSWARLFRVPSVVAVNR